MDSKLLKYSVALSWWPSLLNSFAANITANIVSWSWRLFDTGWVNKKQWKKRKSPTFSKLGIDQERGTPKKMASEEKQRRRTRKLI